jgi:hypothetical protein
MQADVFHVVSVYTQGAPHDRGLPLAEQAAALRSLVAPHCERFHALSVSEVRKLQLSDGTAGAQYTRDFTRSAWAARTELPNPGVASVGFWAYKPFVLLWVLEQLAREGDVALYLDCNLAKHWRLGAFPHLMRVTARWLLESAGAASSGVGIALENGATTLLQICSARAIRGAEANKRCDGRSLRSTLSPHANRVAARKGAAEGALRAWLVATLEEDYLPAQSHRIEMLTGAPVTLRPARRA